MRTIVALQPMEDGASSERSTAQSPDLLAVKIMTEEASLLISATVTSQVNDTSALAARGGRLEFSSACESKDRDRTIAGAISLLVPFKWAHVSD